MKSIKDYSVQHILLLNRIMITKVSFFEDFFKKKHLNSINRSQLNECETIICDEIQPLENTKALL